MIWQWIFSSPYFSYGVNIKSFFRCNIKDEYIWYNWTIDCLNVFSIKFCCDHSVFSCLDITTYWRCNYLLRCWMHGEFPAYGSISFLAGSWSTFCLQLGEYVFPWCGKLAVTYEAQTFLSASCTILYLLCK